MLDMQLEKLLVHPNPFLENPRAFARSKTFTGIVRMPERLGVSPTIFRLSRVLPLVELSLRQLLSPNETKCVLEQYYVLPLEEKDLEPLSAYGNGDGKQHVPLIPASFRRILDVCCPGSVYIDPDDNTPPGEERITGLGICPSPLHTQQKSVFVQHAEERYTWEEKVANVVDLGGAVPVRWRGCSWGCLDFLVKEECSSPAPAPVHEEGRHETEVDGAADEEEELSVVQTLDFSSGSLSMDEEFE